MIFYLCYLMIEWQGRNFVRRKTSYNLTGIQHFYKYFQFTILFKDGGKRFRYLFCFKLRAYFRCNDENCTYWILMHSKKPVYDSVSFFFLYGFKIQMFFIFCGLIYYLIKTFISFASSFIFRSNNAYFIQYYFSIMSFTYNNNNFWMLYQQEQEQTFSGVIQDSLCFQNKIGFRWLLLVSSSGMFLSSFVKMAVFEGIIKDSSDIFLSDNSFPLIRLFKASTCFLYFFSNLRSLVISIIRTFTLILRNFLFSIICKSPVMIYP